MLQHCVLKYNVFSDGNHCRLHSSNDRFLFGWSGTVYSMAYRNLDAYLRPRYPWLGHGCSTGCELHGCLADIYVSRIRVALAVRSFQLFLHITKCAIFRLTDGPRALYIVKAK